MTTPAPSSASPGKTLEALGGWPALFKAMAGAEALDIDLAVGALESILAGDATDGQIGGFAMGLRARGERAEEIAAFVEVMLSHAVPLDLGSAAASAIDIVGTGGAKTGMPAMNVSTMASFVVAGCGVPVCKHGNRKASSTSGSTDVLEELGIAVELDSDGVSRCVAEAGVGFAFARVFHPAMRHAGPVRAQLGTPTVFNLLGPLSNPARVTRMVLGVSDLARAELMIRALEARGLTHAMVVTGLDGLDEFTLNGETQVFELADGTVSDYRFHPSDVGLSVAAPEDIAGGDATHNAELARSILGGAPGARRDIVVLNAAGGLVVGGAAANLADGVARARDAIDSGAAAAVLERLIEVSNAVS